jgi:DNA-binding MarR family transcriptional regulator
MVGSFNISRFEGLPLMQSSVLHTSDYLTSLCLVLSKTRRELNAMNDLALPQFHILDNLGRKGGILTVLELGVTLGYSPSTLSYHLNRLDGIGATERRRDNRNRRVIRTSLTRKGQDIYQNATETVQNVMLGILMPLGNFLNEWVLGVAQTMTRIYGVDPKPSNLAFLEEYLLWGAFHCGRQIEPIVAEHDRTFKEYRVLFELMEHSHGISCNKLAKRLLLTLPDLTNTLNRLCEFELALRRDDHLDRRVTWVELTTEGYRVLRQLTEKVEAVYRKGMTETGENAWKLLTKATTIVTEHQRKSFRIL